MDDEELLVGVSRPLAFQLPIDDTAPCAFFAGGSGIALEVSGKLMSDALLGRISSSSAYSPEQNSARRPSFGNM
jgi:hypothetical protein